ncbi:hypothetical protein EJ04DRAFT_510737 [Polyplosphaeria fusca]|uniref:Uncharacterized protein n=1 Tax=Polyplosphaeria fusca TaxID=682080 RepID=A0A9P4V5X4_9PLEO|nr:hypothetical protein EJ04DRAFT_510737 [Polyplosphaeria fusca]
MQIRSNAPVLHYGSVLLFICYSRPLPPSDRHLEAEQAIELRVNRPSGSMHTIRPSQRERTNEIRIYVCTREACRKKPVHLAGYHPTKYESFATDHNGAGEKD